MKQIVITKVPVELFKVLKFEGLVSCGGEAKSVIEEGQVFLNGTLETRKRKKIVPGDIIEFKHQKYKTVHNGQNGHI